MNATIRSGLVNLLTKALGALSPASSVAGARVAAALTAGHFSALTRFLPLIPISDLIALATGAGDADNLLDVAATAAAMIARAFPPGAIPAEEVSLGLEALQLLIDAAGLGSTPIRIEPGEQPLVTGFAGARGHIL